MIQPLNNPLFPDYPVPKAEPKTKKKVDPKRDFHICILCGKETWGSKDRLEHIKHAHPNLYVPRPSKKKDKPPVAPFIIK